MNTFLFHSDSWLVTFGCLLIIRQFFIILAAEQGRKQDLIKKLYQANTNFNITVLIPYLHSSHYGQLLLLLKSLADQHYPAAKVSIHIASSDDTLEDLKKQSFNTNIKLWTYPHAGPTQGAVTAWLIERCLAAGNTDFFTLLRPFDIVKPDYFQNIVSRGMEHSVIQGYIARKQPPSHPLDQVIALENRLRNRIGNAGHFHMGLSCNLMAAGWAIKHDVLEMIPFQQNVDRYNLEYSLRLNLQNYRVVWAPNVVIYTEEHIGFFQYITMNTAILFNRLQLIVRYSFPLLVSTFLRLNFTYLEDLLLLLSPPAFGVALFLFGMAFQGFHGKPVFAQPGSWLNLGIATIVLFLLGLVVSRAKRSDYLTAFLWMPVFYMVTLLCLPFTLIHAMAGALIRRQGLRKIQRYKQNKTTRFNEAITPTVPKGRRRHNQHDEHDEFYTEASPESPIDYASSFQQPSKQASADMDYSLANPHSEAGPQNREQVKMVTLLFQGKQVECRLLTHTTHDADGNELYQMVLEYKGHSFATACYKILDQAFYELYAKLQSRGLTIYTCGSCGNFFNPTADAPQMMKNIGICLHDKLGQEVSLSSDAVTVLTEACPSHCPATQRESIVRRWRESLVEISKRKNPI